VLRALHGFALKEKGSKGDQTSTSYIVLDFAVYGDFVAR